MHLSATDDLQLRAPTAILPRTPSRTTRGRIDAETLCTCIAAGCLWLAGLFAAGASARLIFFAG